MIVELDVQRTDQQVKAWNALADPIVRRLMYGGAKGGGKSYFLCIWLFAMVWEIMVAANLDKPSNNPPHVAWFGRKQATDLTGTTLQTWREIIPEEYYKLRGGTEKDPKHILIADRIAIDYGGLDKQDNINKFNSAEYIIIAVDQAEEVSKDDISVLRGSLRMVLKNEDGSNVVPRNKKGKIIIDPLTKKPYDHWPFKELYTANPRQCWLRDDFIIEAEEDARFVPALPADNPHLPSGYIQTLESAFGHRPELLKAYRDGDWNAIEGAEQIILNAWVDEAKLRTCYAPRYKMFLVCDTARFGDDECVILLMQNAEILGKKILGRSTAPDIVNRLAVLSNLAEKNFNLTSCPIVIEALGADFGAAVADDLVEMGKEVVRFNPSLKSLILNEQKKPIYHNLRAEAWTNAGKKFASGVLDEESNTLMVCNNMYKQLQKELCVPLYKFKNGKIIIESKDEIKKPQRLGKSPDHADTYVIGLWGWDKVDYNEKDNEEDGYMSKAKRKKVALRPMRMA